jgi:hypothetical protein
LEKRGIGGQELRELPAAGQRVRLRLDPSETVSQAEFIGADLIGTVGGKPISAGRISVFREDSGWCVYSLYVL